MASHYSLRNGSLWQPLRVVNMGCTVAVMPSIPSGPMSEIVRANLRRIREQQGVSLRDLSKRLDDLGHSLLSSGIGRIEQGTRRVDVDDLIALSLALSISPLQLLLPPESRPDSRVALTPDTSMTTENAWSWMQGWRIRRNEPDSAAWAFANVSVPPNRVFLAHDYVKKLRNLLERVKSSLPLASEFAQMYLRELEFYTRQLQKFLAGERDLRQRREQDGYPPGATPDEAGAEDTRAFLQEVEDVLAATQLVIVELDVARLPRREEMQAIEWGESDHG